MAKKTNYSIVRGVTKALVNMAIVAVPMIIQVLPQEWMNMSLSAIILIVVNYIKVKYATK